MTAPLRATALPSLLALAVPLAFAACSGNDAGSASASTTTKGSIERVDQESAGEVVINPPRSSYSVVATAANGSVTGSVLLKSPLPAAQPISTGRDSAQCGATVPDSSLQQRGSGIGGAIVWLDDARKGRPLPLERRLELESDHCLLTPRVQGAVVGSAVNVIGHDPFRQHLRFLVSGENEPRAAVLLGRDEQVIPTNLPAEKPGLVVVRDVDHPWVRSYLAVFDHPYFAVTKPDGTFSIDGVPPGKYTIVAWHERTKRAQETVEIPATGAAKVNLVVEAK